MTEEEALRRAAKGEIVKNGYFETRREQIEKDFLPKILKATNPRARRIAAVAELKNAAVVGGCEERDRILALIRKSALLSFEKDQLCKLITTITVMEVLGYPT